ncbi:ParB/RepB/Spo0J family partition protein [Candidatus Omnitrophota bacterium]
MDKKRGLGRGLTALIPDDVPREERDNILFISTDKVKASRYQPREEFDQERLKDLVASIKEQGFLQPILVRKVDSGYELIAGERRLRAAKTLAIQKVPAIVKSVSEENVLVMSIIENVQREELNPIEEAHSFQRLMNEFNFTQEKIAQSVGKDRASVSNILRLLKLPSEIQEAVSKGSIRMGHARSLLSLETAEEQLKMFRNMLSKTLSVRELESLVNISVPAAKKKKKSISAKRDMHVVALEEELQRLLGTKVRIRHSKKRGKIVIDYYSLEDLDRILEVLRK